jgi:tetratricopeptide (TPR) repeat protein
MLPAQQVPGRDQQPPPKEQEPPEEDESLKPKEYALNPLQALKEINVGNQYFKKGKFRAAAGRYLEATRWDPGSADAFFKLGEADEKMHEFAAARAAYEKYFELAKDARNTEAIKKKIAKWPSSSDAPSNKE